MAWSSRHTQQALFAQFAVVADALAHGHRLALLELLRQGERDVETLSALAGLPVATTSQHLQRLKRAGLVLVRRQGRRQIYCLAGDNVSALLTSLEKVAEACLASAQSMIDKELRAQDEAPPMALVELKRRVKAGDILVLDVRPREEYAAGHLPGAINIPLDALRKGKGQLPRGREIVVYCRGPYCVLAIEALRLLRRRGFSARRLEGGLPDWKLNGLPVEKA